MSIVTRQGDGGRTRLPGGLEVSKTDIRLEALGVLDELVSVLGMARATLDDARHRDAVLQLQRTLFVIGAECAAGRERAEGLPQRLGVEDYVRIDEWIRKLESGHAHPRDFIIPGESLSAALLDFARAVARRAERRIVALAEAGLLDNTQVLKWMNRLSDALWLLARVVERRSRPLHADESAPSDPRS